MGRVLDGLIAAAALALFSPLLLVAAIAVRLSSPGPILFAQRRLGRNGAPFLLYKFRTMLDGAPEIRNADGSAYTGRDDPRLTALGRLLRSASIDELPQLFNVLKGDMAIVGPRPDLLDQLRYYTAGERRKLEVRPGLTGLAQISGRNNISWQQRKALDVEYVERRSLGLDFAIVLKTIPYVLLRKDVQSGQPRTIIRPSTRNSGRGAMLALARGLLFSALAAATLTTWCEGLWTAAMLHAALLAASALFLLSGRALGPAPAPAPAIGWLLLAGAAWAFVQASTGLTAYRHETLVAATYWTAAAALFWLSGRLFFSAPGDPKALRWLLGFASAVALLCVVQRFTSQGKFLWVFDTGYLDIYGPFASYKDYAAFLELIFPFTVLQALEPSPKRSLYAGIGALLFASVVMSASRAGAALLALEFFAVVALTARKRMAEPRRLIASGVLMVALGAALSFAAGWDRLRERLDENDPWAFRRNVTAAALDMFRERPWTGFGMGNFPVVYPAYARFDDGTRMNHAHSDWLEWAVEGGAPLLITMLAVVALTMGPAARSVWGIGVLAVFLHALIDYPFRRLGVAGWIFFVLAGVTHTASEREPAGFENRVAASV